MESKLEKLSINQSTKQHKPTLTPPSKSRGHVADSWDEEDDDDDAASSGSDTTDRGEAPQSGSRTPQPNAPPPTPVSPISNLPSWDSPHAISLSTRLGDRDREERARPETSAAAAGRLIAAGLGKKAPKKTEDQKAYEKAIRENEIQRRNRQREAKMKEQAEEENAVKAVWES